MDEPFRVPTPQEMRTARKDLGLSQYDVADSAGREQASINSMEHGRFNPSLMFVMDVTNALNEEYRKQNE